MELPFSNAEDISPDNGPFIHVRLTADDVPGGHLPNPIIEDNVCRDLRRWLKIRKIPQKGKKKVLIKRFVLSFTVVFKSNYFQVIFICYSLVTLVQLTDSIMI